MDWTTVANLLAAALILKGTEGFGDAVGKALYDTVASKAQAIFNLVKDKLVGKNAQTSLQVLQSFEKDPLPTQESLAHVLRQVASDAIVARELRQSAQQTKNALLDALEKGLTTDNLDELSFRLGFPLGSIYTLRDTHPAKAIALVTAIEAQRRFPELVERMLEINPYLV